MPTYVTRCPNCGEKEFVHSMRAAKAIRRGSLLPCPICTQYVPQVFFPPMFIEDRLRFWKGPRGDGYSYGLGEMMPASRSERDALAKKKGVEFVSEAEFLADNKEAAEAVSYAKHVREGGEKEEWKPIDTSSAFKSKPDWAKNLVG